MEHRDLLVREDDNFTHYIRQSREDEGSEWVTVPRSDFVKGKPIVRSHDTHSDIAVPIGDVANIFINTLMPLEKKYGSDARLISLGNVAQIVTMYAKREIAKDVMNELMEYFLLRDRLAMALIGKTMVTQKQALDDYNAFCDQSKNFSKKSFTALIETSED